jgi:hypothetical protein
MATSDGSTPTPMEPPTVKEEQREAIQPDQARSNGGPSTIAIQRVGVTQAPPAATAPLAAIKSITMWQGGLTWTEMSTTGKEVEMSTQVMAGTAHHQYTYET